MSDVSCIHLLTEHSQRPGADHKALAFYEYNQSELHTIPHDPFFE